MTATVEMAGPFEVTTKPYIIAARAAIPGSERQERDRAVGVSGLFLIVVVIAIGVVFAVVIITGHGKRQNP